MLLTPSRVLLGSRFCLGDQQTAVGLIVPTILRDPHSSTCYWAARLDYLMVPSQLEKWRSWEWKREWNQTGGCSVWCLVDLNGLWRVVAVWESSASLWIFHWVGRETLVYRQIGATCKQTRRINTPFNAKFNMASYKYQYDSNTAAEKKIQEDTTGSYYCCSRATASMHCVVAFPQVKMRDYMTGKKAREHCIPLGCSNLNTKGRNVSLNQRSCLAYCYDWKES